MKWVVMNQCGKCATHKILPFIDQEKNKCKGCDVKCDMRAENKKVSCASSSIAVYVSKHNELLERQSTNSIKVL